METLKKIWNVIILKIFYRLLMLRPKYCYDVVRLSNNYDRRNFVTLDKSLIPPKINGFHDLTYLFLCADLNKGIIFMDFDEGGYMWKVIHENAPKALLEVGRFLGGSTVLIVAAANGSRVISVDSKITVPEYAKDSLLDEHLKRLGLSNYELFVHDSNNFDPQCMLDFVFIDGDHTYESVKKDFENFDKYLNIGGHMLFHGSCSTRPYTTHKEGTVKLMLELKRSEKYKLIREVGSLTHFVKKEK